MKFPLILVCLCELLLMNTFDPIILFPDKESDLIVQDYLDRRKYFENITDTSNKDEEIINLNYRNISTNGPFSFYIFFPFPSKGSNIYSVTLSAKMETRIPSLNGNNTQRIIPENFWIDIPLIRDNQAQNGFLFYYEVSMSVLESTWIKIEGNHISFRTTINFFFNETILNQPEARLIIQCPIIMRKPASNSDFYESIDFALLFDFFHIHAKIENAINASIIPCIDDDPNNLSICIPNDTIKHISFQYAKTKKFVLLINNPEFSNKYYLRPIQTLMRTESMPIAHNFQMPLNYNINDT